MIHRATRTRVAAASLVAAAIVFAGTSQAAETLRWKFKEGDTMSYVMERSMDTKVDLSGTLIELGAGMTFDTTWKVKSVGADGVAEIEQTVDRIQMKMDSPLGGGLDYDSMRPGSGTGQIWEMMGPMFEALVGQSFTMKVSPTGKVTDITLPEKVTEALGGQRGGGGGRRGGLGGMGGMGLSESSIKEMLERSFIRLPEEPIAADLTWTQGFENAMRGAGTLKTEVTYKASDKAEVDGKQVQKIVAATELTFEPAEEAQVDMEVIEQKGESTIFFDVASGRTVKVEGMQHQVMDIVAQGREITQDVTEKVTVRQGKSPPPKADDKPAEEKKDE